VEEKFEKHPVKGEEHFGDKHNMSLMRELLKTRDRNLGEIEKGADNKTQKQVPTEVDTKTGSPIHTGPGPVKGNPHPATLQGFKK